MGTVIKPWKGKKVLTASAIMQAVGCSVKEAIAILKCYKYVTIKTCMDDIVKDFKEENAVIIQARNGKTVIWYIKDDVEVAVYVDNCELLNLAEREAVL